MRDSLIGLGFDPETLTLRGKARAFYYGGWNLQIHNWNFEVRNIEEVKNLLARFYG